GGRGGDGVLDLGFLWVWIPAGGLAAPAGGTGATARTCPGRPRSAPGPGPLEPVPGMDLPAGLVGPRPGFPGRVPLGRRRVLPRRAGGTDSVPDAGGLGGGRPDRALRGAAVRRAARPWSGLPRPKAPAAIARRRLGRCFTSGPTTGLTTCSGAFPRSDGWFGSSPVAPEPLHGLGCHQAHRAWPEDASPSE